MSEFINNNKARVDSLFDFCYRLIKGEKGSELIKKISKESREKNWRRDRTIG